MSVMGMLRFQNNPFFDPSHNMHALQYSLIEPFFKYF